MDVQPLSVREGSRVGQEKEQPAGVYFCRPPNPLPDRLPPPSPIVLVDPPVSFEGPEEEAPAECLRRGYTRCVPFFWKPKAVSSTI